MKFPVIVSFFIATFFTLFISAFFPGFKPVFYAPFFAIVFLNSTFISSLWLGIISGLIIDLFSSRYFGINALTCVLCISLLYNQKKYFKDSVVSISLFSCLISFSYMTLAVILLYIFDKGPKLGITWFFTDFVLMSIIDGIYALLFFAIPIKTLKLLKKNSF
jgi:rod shape-determining protein MreD